MSLCACVCMGQSFLSVKYGTPYNQALSLFQEKYHDNCEGGGESIIIVSPKVGSCVFDCGIANFSMVNGQSVLDGGVLFAELPQSERATHVGRMKDLVKLLEQKYGEDTMLSEDSESFYFGKALRSDDKWLGSLSIVDKPSQGISALVLNYSKILSSQTDDL